MKPTTIFFVRHGEVYNKNDILYARLPRFHLSEKGRQETDVTAKFLAREPIGAIYSSPMLRARQTAQIIRRYHPTTPLHISKYLNEIRTSYQGASRAELNRIEWNFYDHRLSDCDETREQILARLQQQLKRTLRHQAGQKVVWVAHGDLVIVLTLWAKGLPLGALQTYKGANYIGHGSVTKFVFDGAGDKALSVEYFDPPKAVSGTL